MSIEEAESLVKQTILGSNQSSTTQNAASPILIAARSSQNLAGNRTASPKTVGPDAIYSAVSAILKALNTINSTLTDISNNTIGANLGATNVNLPTADPAISGALWNDAGTVKVSP